MAAEVTKVNFDFWPFSSLRLNCLPSFLHSCTTSGMIFCFIMCRGGALKAIYWLLIYDHLCSFQTSWLLKKCAYKKKILNLPSFPFFPFLILSYLSIPLNFFFGQPWIFFPQPCIFFPTNSTLHLIPPPAGGGNLEQYTPLLSKLTRIACRVECRDCLIERMSLITIIRGGLREFFSLEVILGLLSI